MTRPSGRRRTWILVVAVGLVATACGYLSGWGLSRHGGGGSPAAPVASVRPYCPWVEASRRHGETPAELAAQVVARMTLREKVTFVVLVGRHGYENVNAGVPSLCIPPLTLTDGPDGIAYGAKGVTRLPAAIGLAATFDPSVAYATGRVEGSEARTKGIDVVQGPELNLARVPESGRIFEAYGEDPYLTAALGTANVQGIQSEGVMADAKHFTAYNQETAREVLNQDVSLRALEEVYDAPFEAVVKRGHVASVMCAYGSLNGINTCSDPFVYRTLRSWHFGGFVRSDLLASPRPVAAFAAGLDLIKPKNARALIRQVTSGVVPVADLDRAVTQTLTMMFAYGLVAHPRPPAIHAVADSARHAAVARWAAQRSIVLLKDRDGTLPLSPKVRSLALIGTDGGSQAATTGLGSSRVRAPFVVSPLRAIGDTVSHGTHIAYVPADSTRSLLPPVPSGDLVSGAPIPVGIPDGDTPIRPFQPGAGDLHVDLAPKASRAADTAIRPGHGPGWSTWHAVLDVPDSGTYELSLQHDGDTWLYVDGRPLINVDGRSGLARRGHLGLTTWSTTLSLVAGHRYDLSIRWLAVGHDPYPKLGFADVSPEIATAVQAARASAVAVVFAGDVSSESIDQPDLSLPGDADPLIAAVAAANPHTIVVLNTGGPVVMPWLDRVAAVLEAWYPGEEDGNATAAVLFGHVDPSGHLPVTFPTSRDPSPVGSPAQFPGIDASVHYREGLDIGYRWYQAHHVEPLFPFGFGLSYTSFVVGAGQLHTEGADVVARVTVTNTGRRTGGTVVQAYVQYPPSAGEPPEQLRAFKAVTLKASQSRIIHLLLPRAAFEAFLDGRFRVVPGRYHLDIGLSSANLPVHLTTTAP